MAQWHNGIFPNYCMRFQCGSKFQTLHFCLEAVLVNYPGPKWPFHNFYSCSKPNLVCNKLLGSYHSHVMLLSGLKLTFCTIAIQDK